MPTKTRFLFWLLHRLPDSWLQHIALVCNHVREDRIVAYRKAIWSFDNDSPYQLVKQALPQAIDIVQELARRNAPIEDDCLDEPTAPRPPSAPPPGAFGWQSEPAAIPLPPPESPPLDSYPEVQIRLAEEAKCATSGCKQPAPFGKRYCEGCDPF